MTENMRTWILLSTILLTSWTTWKQSERIVGIETVLISLHARIQALEDDGGDVDHDEECKVGLAAQ